MKQDLQTIQNLWDTKGRQEIAVRTEKEEKAKNLAWNETKSNPNQINSMKRNPK